MRIFRYRTALAVLLSSGACTSIPDDRGAGQTDEPGAAAVPVRAPRAALDLTQFVNPLIGTDDSNSPNPVPGGAGGSTYPGPLVPFGMVQLSPDTPTASPSGYRNRDTTIEDFSLTHFDGAGCANNEDVNILPVTGALGSSPGTAWTSYASAYTKASESATAGFYRTVLDRYATTSGTDLSDIDFYRAFATYKLAVIAQGGARRVEHTDPERAARVTGTVQQLADLALELTKGY